MLFENEIFAPHALKDRRTEQVLLAAVDHATEKIRPSDLLFAAITSKDVKVITTLTQVLETGSTLQDVLDPIAIYNRSSSSRLSLSARFNGRKEWFSPEALTALEQFDAELTELNSQSEKVSQVMLELLLAHVLAHLDDEDQENLPILNAREAVNKFRELVKTGIETLPDLFDSASERLSSEEFSETCWAIMEYAAIRAAELGYDRILPPHCFLALLSETEGVAEYLVRLQAQPDVGPGKVAQIVSEAFRLADPRKEPIELKHNSIGEATVNILTDAQRTARLWGADKIDTPHLLSALLEEISPRLVSVLQGSVLGLDIERMRKHLNEYLRETRKHTRREVPFRLPVGLFPSEDMTYRARTEGIVEAVVAHKQKQNEDIADPYDAMTRALYRRNNNNVLITGLRGIGKTTLVWELARRAAAGKIPFLRRKRFLWVDCQDVSPHESKDKFEGLLAQIAGRTDLILCLDGLGPLLRAESGSNNKLILRKALKERKIQLIGILSNQDFEDLLASDHELLEYFTRVKLEEPDEETARAIVKQVSSKLEQEYKAVIEEQAIERAVFLSANYILNERLPGKAIKILQQVCDDLDYARTQRPDEQKETPTPDIITVRVEHVVNVIAEISGVPQETLRGKAKKVDYDGDLRLSVVGQDEAVKAVAKTLRLIKAGLTDPGKPASVLLFAGLTGVGKTELAKALARFYSTSKRLQTYTMGNFIESHSVSGIIGVPPGYVGHEQGGRLINDLNSDPYCVFLLDEAEKAHPDVWKPFLNLFDEAWMTDTRGVKAFADRAIFILTTNAGAKDIFTMSQQGKSIEAITETVKSSLLELQHERSGQKVFSPEFLARISHIIIFKPLDYTAMEGICRKQLKKMQETWKLKRKKTLVVPDELIQYIARYSHEKNSKGTEGGRIVSKLMSEMIEARIQEEQSKHEDEYDVAEVVELKFSLGEVTVKFHKPYLD